MTRVAGRAPNRENPDRRGPAKKSDRVRRRTAINLEHPRPWTATGAGVTALLGAVGTLLAVVLGEVTNQGFDPVQVSAWILVVTAALWLATLLQCGFTLWRGRGYPRAGAGVLLCLVGVQLGFLVGTYLWPLGLGGTIVQIIWIMATIILLITGCVLVWWRDR